MWAARLHKFLSLPLGGPSDRSALSSIEELRLASESRLIVFRTIGVLAGLIAITMPLFAILDFFAYPEKFELFLALRFLCAALVMSVAFVCKKTPLGKRYFRVYTVFIPLIPAFFIALMIYISGDPLSPYYAGMILSLVLIGFVSQWTLTEAVIASSLVILFYYAAISPAFFKGLDLKGHVILIGNCLFTFAFALVVTVGSYLNEETRLREFRSRQRTRNERYKLAVKNKQLKRTMDELEETEDQLIQSEKMASLGQLSAGVIHEIGNPLNYSNQALFLARRLVDRGETGSEVAEALSDMQESLDRIKGIVRDLRDFSHKGRETTTCFAVLDAIKVAVRMLKKEILDSGTEVRVAIGSEWIVEADRNQLSQVFINLIHNSIQAMSANDRGRGNQILLMARRRADAVQILVRDNGPGIPEENLGKIFDPFFTTKVRGEGTGLGLSICYRIIEANNGTIRVESIVGEYTEFILTVPLHLEEFEDSKPRFAENHEQHHEQAVS